MENSNMKNMVVLRNLPSNIVEEAIVILKSNKQVRKLEKIDKQKNKDVEDIKPKDKNYILKEAEILVNSYVEKLEKKDDNNNKNKDKKYITLKKYNWLITLIAILEFIGLLIR